MATQMKAAFIRKCGGPEVLEVGELPKPSVKPDQVRVRVRYAALNHLDIWVRKGLPSLKMTFPHILSGDASGVVDAIGELVTHVKVGDEVIVHPGVSCGHCADCLAGWESLCLEYRILGEHVSGTTAEFVSVPAANIFLKPASLSMKDAAAIPLVMTTAWQMAVVRGKVSPRDTLLIYAAGSGVSSAAIQIAKLHGAKVIATAGSDAKMALAKNLGADWVLNHQDPNFVANVRNIVGKRGVDLILDHVGKTTWGNNIKLLRRGGKMVICGASSGADAPTDLAHLFYRQLELVGSTMGSKADFPAILNLLGEGRLRAVVDRTFSLADVAEAHRYLESRAQFGKILIEILAG